VQVNTTTNVSKPFVESYSIASNATLAEFGNATVEYDQYNLYTAATTYALWGDYSNPTCFESTLTGALTPLPVEYFTFQGAATFNGSPAYVWVGGTMTYVTDQTVMEAPLALIDNSNHMATVFVGYMAIAPNAWPAGYFSKPPQCA